MENHKTMKTTGNTSDVQSTLQSPNSKDLKSEGEGDPATFLEGTFGDIWQSFWFNAGIPVCGGQGFY